jgi:hypothetical protein
MAGGGNQTTYDEGTRRDAEEVRRFAAHMGVELPERFDGDMHPAAQCMNGALMDIIQLTNALRNIALTLGVDDYEKARMVVESALASPSILQPAEAGNLSVNTPTNSSSLGITIPDNDPRPQKHGGLRPIKGLKPRCIDPSHEPPTHIVIPPGYEYEHVCPSCGFTIVLWGHDVTL